MKHIFKNFWYRLDRDEKALVLFPIALLFIAILAAL